MIGDVLVNLANGLPLTYDETEELRALNFVDVGKPPVRQLSQITEDLGHVRFGSVICGTGDPFDTTSGNFSGMGIFNPPLSFTAGDYNLVGCNAGVLQAGISSVDGKFYAAAGDVILDENGISVVSGVAGSNYYKIVDSIGGITNMYISSMIVAADTFTNLVSTNTGGTASISLVAASFGATKTPRIEITAYGGAANFGSIAINANSSQADTTINGTSGVLVRVNASTNNVGIGGAAETGYMLKVTGKIKTDTEVISPLFTGDLAGSVTGASSLNVLKTGDTMTGALTVNIPTATNNIPQTALTLKANVTGGGAANNFGTYLNYFSETATDGTERQQAQLVTYWVDSTDATRTARQIYRVYDTAQREAFRIEASGTAAMIGFLGAAAIARPTAYTQTYATAARTHTQTTMTDPAAYGAGTNGYSTAGQASAIHAEVIALRANMLVVQQVLNSVINDLQGYGLLA